MNKVIMIILILSFSRVFADEWFCKSASSRVLQSEVMACGYAYKRTEAIAREDALYRAMDEFANICNAQSDNKLCLKRGWTMIPERTECEKTKSGSKCWRSVRFVFNH